MFIFDMSGEELINLSAAIRIVIRETSDGRMLGVVAEMPKDQLVLLGEYENKHAAREALSRLARMLTEHNVHLPAL